MWLHLAATIIIVLASLRSTHGDDGSAPFLSGGSNTSNYITKIINSEPANDGRYAYAQVSLQLPDSSGVDLHQCGGSIIAEDMILTAGHCAIWFDKIIIDRYALEDSNETSFTSYTPKSITVHPQFDSILFRYDFTVVQINESINSAILPIRLNQNTTLPKNGDAMTILGWGATGRDGSTGDLVFPSEFQKGQVFAIDNAECAATVIDGQILYQGEIYEEMLCAQALGVDACSGDSGGPMILEGGATGDLQVGIVSWGRGCAIYPGVYSRVSEGYDWIRKQVCYQSKNPPSYFKCLVWERDPKYGSTNAEGKGTNATSPSALPTVSPTPRLTGTPTRESTGTPTTRSPSRAPTRQPAVVLTPETATPQMSPSSASSPSRRQTTGTPSISVNRTGNSDVPVSISTPIAVSDIVGAPSDISRAPYQLMRGNSILILSCCMLAMTFV